jgi:P27 family predicted phage terminase small subunit
MKGHDKEPRHLTDAEMESFMALCPTELGPVARAEWKRVVPVLMELKLLKHLDLAIVGLYCSAYASWLEATQAIQEFGSVIKTASGYPVQSPFVAIANHQASVIMKCANELCLTPASRIKVLQERKFTYWANADEST